MPNKATHKDVLELIEKLYESEKRIIELEDNTNLLLKRIEILVEQVDHLERVNRTGKYYL